MAPRFVHHGCSSLTEVRSCRQTGNDHRGAKPDGLWLSIVDESGHDGWADLCRTTGNKLKRCATEIIFGPDARILSLTDAEAIDGLSAEFGYSIPRTSCQDGPEHNTSAIYWEKVAELYDAVIAAPHCAGRHVGKHWYFAWDIASACVWSPAAVAEVKPYSQVGAGRETSDYLK